MHQINEISDKVLASYQKKVKERVLDKTPDKKDKPLRGLTVSHDVEKKYPAKALVDKLKKKGKTTGYLEPENKLSGEKEDYTFKGKQWVSKKTGKMADKETSEKLHQKANDSGQVHNKYANRLKGFKEAEKRRNSSGYKTKEVIGNVTSKVKKFTNASKEYVKGKAGSILDKLKQKVQTTKEPEKLLRKDATIHTFGEPKKREPLYKKDAVKHTLGEPKKPEEKKAKVIIPKTPDKPSYGPVVAKEDDNKGTTSKSVEKAPEKGKDEMKINIRKKILAKSGKYTPSDIAHAFHRNEIGNIPLSVMRDTDVLSQEVHHERNRLKDQEKDKHNSSLYTPSDIAHKIHRGESLLKHHEEVQKKNPEEVKKEVKRLNAQKRYHEKYKQTLDKSEPESSSSNFPPKDTDMDIKHDEKVKEIKSLKKENSPKEKKYNAGDSDEPNYGVHIHHHGGVNQVYVKAKSAEEAMGHARDLATKSGNKNIDVRTPYRITSERPHSFEVRYKDSNGRENVAPLTVHHGNVEGAKRSAIHHVMNARDKDGNLLYPQGTGHKVHKT